MSTRSFVAQNYDLFLAAAITVCAVYFLSGRFTTVRFDRERIEIKVDGSRIQVKGLYCYQNASALPAVLTLRVPFPVDHEHPQPTSIALYKSNAASEPLDELVPSQRGNEVFVRLVFRPREAKWVRLDYTQPTRVASGRYLLTTTRAWRRPITRADFALRVPEQLNLVSSNYPLHKIPSPAAERNYGFSRQDFYPGQDWVFEWAPVPLIAANSMGEKP